ncbi:ABC transporter permease subunit [Staphylococcus xylosus]
MFSIISKEFTSLGKNIKSIIVVAIILCITLGIAKLVSLFEDQLGNLGVAETPYSMGLLLTVLLASPLFIFALSHNVINEEVKTRTIRFLATKTNRPTIIIGKFLGALLFWFLILLITTLLIIIYSHEFYYIELLQSVVFISYYLSLAVFLSVLINSTVLTNFLGIALPIVMTILGIWSSNSNNVLLQIYSYITPYYYFFQGDKLLPFVVVVFPIIFTSISIILFQKRDL